MLDFEYKMQTTNISTGRAALLHSEHKLQATNIPPSSAALLHVEYKLAGYGYSYWLCCMGLNYQETCSRFAHVSAKKYSWTNPNAPMLGATTGRSHASHQRRSEGEFFFIFIN